MNGSIINKVVWTIGHSTHSLEHFLEMLKSFKIEMVADIRSYPGSRKFPHFNKENLETSLPEAGIEYLHMKTLGGRRKVLKNSLNTAWRKDSFRGYADYMETLEFADAIKELADLCLSKRTVYMCSESLWWRCHRSMVSDYLKNKGWEVNHIMSTGKSIHHTYTEPAKIIEGKLNYR